MNPNNNNPYGRNQIDKEEIMKQYMNSGKEFINKHAAHSNQTSGGYNGTNRPYNPLVDSGNRNDNQHGSSDSIWGNNYIGRDIPSYPIRESETRYNYQEAARYGGNGFTGQNTYGNPPNNYATPGYYDYTNNIGPQRVNNSNNLTEFAKNRENNFNNHLLEANYRTDDRKNPRYEENKYESMYLI